MNQPPTPPVERVSTGNPFLDASLDGGLPSGMIILVEGEEGAGSTEFAFAALRAALKRGRRARFLSELRSSNRINAEACALLGDASIASAIDMSGTEMVNSMLRHHLAQTCALAVADLDRGDVLVIESVSALYRGGDAHSLATFVQNLGDGAAATGALVCLLHATGSVPDEVAALVKESVDGHVVFGWRDGTASRRRVLTVPKLRGLAAVVEGEQVPIFEFDLVRGAAFRVSRVKNVV